MADGMGATREFDFGAEQAPAPNPMPRARRRMPVDQGQTRVSRVRRFFFGSRVGWVLLALAVLAGAAAAVLGYRAVRGFLEQDPRFRIASSGSIQIVGTAELSRAELLSVFGADLGRNIFFVPLARRQAELEQVPWVKQASVMRLLPDQLRVSVVERVPIAFVRVGSSVELIDADGVILHLAPATLAARHYSFPVIAGVSPSDSPVSRATRMQLYQRFVAELDAGAGQPVSSQLSEVDLADPEDVRAVVPAQGADILLHFGDTDFLPRYRSYQAHLGEWRRQYPHLSAIDLRYDRQVVLKMADGAESEASSLDHGASLSAAPAAEAPVPHAVARRPAPGGSSSAGAHHTAGHGTAHGWRPR